MESSAAAVVATHTLYMAAVVLGLGIVLAWLEHKPINVIE